KRLMIAAGRSSEELGAKIAGRIGVSLTNPGLKTFANGEIYCRFEESIRGADIFLIQSTAGNEHAGLTANDALMELLITNDAGRVKLARRFARWLGAPYALMEKERPAHGVAEIGRVIGDVKGKVAVILDDMIDTGGTLTAAAQTVMDEGAREVHAVATHGVF